MRHPIRTEAPSRRSARTQSAWILVLALALSVVPGVALAQDGGSVEVGEQAIVVEVEGRALTRAEFDERFDVAVRTAALQQGVPLTEETLAQFADQRGAFLEEVATQLALLHEAEERGVTANEQDVAEAVASFREQFASDAEFTTRVEELGFEDSDALRASVHESLTIRALVDDISADVTPTDDEVRSFFDDHPEQFETTDGEIEFEDVRADIRQFLVQQEVNERIEDIRADADVETHPENL